MLTPKEVQKLYEEADIAIKKNMVNEHHMPISAINELRYAGRHLAEYIGSEDEKDKEIQLEKVAEHCLRAKRDANDIQVRATITEEKTLHRLNYLKTYAALAVGAISLIAAITTLFVEKL